MSYTRGRRQAYAYRASRHRRTHVGTAGFEPATPCSQSRCAAKLRHVPLLPPQPYSPPPSGRTTRSRARWDCGVMEQGTGSPGEFSAGAQEIHRKGEAYHVWVVMIILGQPVDRLLGRQCQNLDDLLAIGWIGRGVGQLDSADPVRPGGMGVSQVRTEGLRPPAVHPEAGEDPWRPPAAWRPPPRVVLAGRARRSARRVPEYRPAGTAILRRCGTSPPLPPRWSR